MLKTRVLTAVLLLAALLPSIFFLTQFLWALLTAVISGVAAWEWGRLVRLSKASCVAYGGALAFFCALIAYLAPTVIGAELSLFSPSNPGVLVSYGLAVLFWLVIVPLWLNRKWHLSDAWLGMVVGVIVIMPAWMALVQLRILGPGVLLAILAVVWVADIAAYFSGKAFGRHKLAPSISPGKTWEGAIGAAFGVLAYGLVMRSVFEVGAISTGWWVVGLVAVTAVSVLGDLFESLLKRQTGLKDSSHILPGHGGVLDRIDSLTSALPTVALLWLLFVFRSA